MRVGIVAEYGRPWPGGIAEHVHHEAVELRRRGHQVVVLAGSASFRPDPPEPRVLRLGAALAFSRNGVRSKITFGRYVYGMGALLRRLRLDVVHVHGPLDTLPGLAAALASEVATVGTFHSSFEPSPLPALLYRALRPLSRRAFDALHVRTAVSEEARRSIARYFPADYEIVPNGVDVERFHPEVAPHPHVSGSPRILFVGRADARKGVPLLLAAFARVRRVFDRAHLTVVGHLRPRQLRHFAAALGRDAEAVTFTGYVAPALLPGYYAACDVVCSSATRQESQGVVLLEGMAAGRPAVAFDIPGYRSVIRHGGDGWLVPRVGAEPLADALIHVLSHTGLRQTLGAAARKSALDYAWPVVVDRLESCLARARGAAHAVTSSATPTPPRTSTT